MARYLPPLWLFGAVLYTAGTLLLVQPFPAGTEPGSLIVPITETIKAKQPPAEEAQAALPPLPRPEIGHFRLGQWVQVARYTAVLRDMPGSSGHVLGGAPVGEPFRVVALDGDFARVQDLGSGQFGWMQKSDLGSYTDGYRPRHVTFAPQVVAAASATALPASEQKIAAAVPAQAAPQLQQHPYTLGPVAEESLERDTSDSQKPVRVALDDSLGSIMQRAFRGAH